jgi:D-alanyl-D-alanine carboxypeptidase/D-alanyl-D-alanine-endopeptidase (penicillin-binding protein 4)
VQTQTSVPLSLAECGDYRSALLADLADPSRIRFAGSYPASCGEKVWPVAYADPKSYGLRAVHGLWLAMGGKLEGVARFGTVPAPLASARPTFEVSSSALAEVVREINKFSNNVMAQQVFLTLANLAPAGSSGNRFELARTVVQTWWKERISQDEIPVLDNGSGLSRRERASAQGLARLLQTAYGSPSMSELMSSLPITGVDGTLKRAKARAIGSAHLKTGSLSNVIARGGYVDGASGKRYVLVAIINHPNANTEASRAAMEALVEWAIKDN